MRHLKIYGVLPLTLVAGLCAQSTPPAAPNQQAQPVGPPNQPAQTAQPSSPSIQPPVQPAQPPATQSAASSSTTVAAYGEITGIVESGNVPLPGVTVTAANTLTGKKYFTSTDVDGSFKIAVTGKGRYVIKAEFSAFAPITQEVLINDENRNGKAELAMLLLSRAEREAQQEQRQQMAQQIGNVGRNGAGMQQLALSGAGGGNSVDVGGGNTDVSSLTSAGLPNAGLAAEGGNESVAISGSQGRAEENMFDPGEMQDRMADMRQQIAIQGGGAGNFQIMGGGGFGGGGFGGGGPMIIMMGGGGRGSAISTRTSRTVPFFTAMTAQGWMPSLIR